MTAASHVKKLSSVGACAEAMKWARGQDSESSAWANCQRGDWMLWLLGRLNDSEPWSDGRKALVACAMDCALLAKRYWPVSKKKEMAAAVATIKKWCRGKATTGQSQKARTDIWACAAYAASLAAASSAAAAAASDSATYAAAAASDSATYAAAAASYSATYAADALATYAAAAGSNCLAECADIVRKHFPTHPKI